LIDRIHRFKRLLQTKEREQTMLQEELSSKEQEKAELERLLDELSAQKEVALNDFCRDADRSQTINELWLRREALDRLGRALDEGRQRLCYAAEDVDDARDRLLHKHREVQTFSTALDGIRDAWRFHCLKREQDQLDDLTASRFALSREREDGS
jgi:flagellar export protein FliJ